LKPSLQLVADVPGERLVLAAPPGVIDELRGIMVSGWRTAVSFGREIRGRPRTARGLLGSFVMVLVAVTLAALVLLACVMAVVGVGLVVVLYAIGVWLVAWLVVPLVARWVIDTRSRGGTRTRLRQLSFENGAVSWDGGRRSFASLTGLRVSIRPRTGAPSDLVLLLLAPAETASRLHFSVANVDREQEVFDLCMRIARVLGWQAFATSRDRLQGIEIELRPSAPPERAHPFRSYAAAPRFFAIGERSATATDWTAAAPSGFREPAEPAPAFAPSSIESAGARVTIWKPGESVELRAGRSVGVARIGLALVVATLVAVALPVSVLVMINAVGGQRLLETHQGGRLSFAGVLSMFTRFSAGAGAILALVLAIRRSGRKTSTFDWRSRELTFRDDDGRHRIAFDEIVELVLTETADRRYALSATLETRASRSLLESEPGGAHGAYLSLMIELARGLGVAWRCVSDLP
jgi:hypothetical protein